MPTTYTPLATTTLGSNAGTVTLSGISGSYTDLVLVMSIIGNAAQEIYFRVNGDTGSNYSGTRLSGNGTTATSARASNQNVGFISGIATTSTTNPNFNSISYFQNYSNTTTFKTVLSRANNANAGTEGFVSTWRNTAAITSIEISSSTSSFAAGSTFSLYGIASTTASIAKATGGTITYNGSYVYHTFTSSGTFTPTEALTADVLVVGGGGGSGGSLTNDKGSAGGGAGGVIYFASQSLSATGYSITVGAGGAAGPSSGTISGSNGTDSQFASLTVGLGGGGGGGGAGGDGPSASHNGKNGGSGGGSTRNGTAGTTTQSSSGATAAYGNNGGTGQAGTNGGAGGGGAGAAGSNVTGGSNAGSAGGNGINVYSSWAIATGTGDSGYYAGGGGGGSYSGGTSSGGLGGGGIGAANNTQGNNGTANTGGGAGGTGGGASYPAHAGNTGGSGIVIVRYAV